MNKSKLRVCFYDNIGGSYLPQAIKLAPFFTHMYYYTSYKSPFPLITPGKVGMGYDEIEVIETFWDHIANRDIDLVIFPDTYSAEIGEMCRKAGVLTFGGGLSEQLELNRNLFYSVLERLNMNNGDYGAIHGITKLKAFLKNKKNKYVKLSWARGELETFKWISLNYNQQLLDELEFNLGPLGDTVDFVVQDLIKADVETGMDSFAVNGQLPNKFLVSIEIKDAGALSRASSINDSPEPVFEINRQFDPALKSYAHTGMYSTEIRYDPSTKESYYIDPCVRMPNPCSLTNFSMCDNWGEVIENAAKGVLVEPHYKYKYGVEIVLKSDYTDSNFMPVFFDPAFKNNINLKGSFIIDDITYVIPFKRTCGFSLHEIGSVVVVGNDYNDIIKQAIDIADSIQAYDIHYSQTALEEALKQMQILEEELNWKF
jgi:hypothetical protein